MKQEAGKKSKKLLWLIIALAAVVAVAGVLLGVFWSDLFGGPGSTPGLSSELYWNVDRAVFVDTETGMSNRQPGEDGLFAIRYAYNGQVVELKVTGDKKLVNYIDRMDVMALAFDADGIIIDAADPKQVATELVKDNYISEIGEGFIRVNSSKAMSGMSTKVKITADTKIYDVSVGATPIGKETTCSQLDCVTVYADADGNATYVYITSRSETGDLYYIFGTKYSTATKETTRVPDANGVYTFTAAHEGALVELKCKDKDVMSSIDAAGGLFGLKLDSDGYVIKKLDAAAAMLGIKEFSNYTITELNGNTFTATRFMVGVEQGNTYTGTLLADADVFIVETYCTAEFIGQRTELRLGDRIDLWTDLEGNPKVAIIVSRPVDSPMYWNVTQSYNWSTYETSRTPDADGYYHVTMIVDGKTVELRTKDKALMTAIDEKEERAVGLQLKGDIIQDVYHARCVCRLYAAGTNRYVTEMSGNVIQIAKTRDWTDASNYLVTKDCKVYDMSGYYGTTRGETTTVRKYDCVTAFQNESSELTHIFITSRYVEDAKVYFHYSKESGRKDGVTTRKTNEAGYYVFDMSCEGKKVQVKTKDAKLATYIDDQWPNYVALTVKKDGTITNAYPAAAAVKGGFQSKAGFTVKSVSETGLVANGWRNETTGIVGTASDLQLASNCVVYNVTSSYEKNFGETTTLMPGDQITTICAYPSGEVVQAFVIRRQVDSPLYWHYQKYSTTTVGDVKETTRPTDADGYYVFELIDNGKIVKLKTKDKALATTIDSNSQAFCLTQKNGIITNFYGPTLAAPDTTRYGVGGYDIMSMETNAETNITTATAVRNYLQASDYGSSSTFVIRDDCRIICVDKKSSDFGKAVKLQLGDRVVTYRDPESRATYIFIQVRNTHKEGHISYCEHCDKQVLWEPFQGEFCRDDTYAKTTVFHYYMTADQGLSYAPAIGHKDTAAKNYEIVLDLNGKTYTGDKHAFTIYSGDTLTVLDTVGGGKLQGKAMSGAETGVLYVQGTLNLLSGTICLAPDAETGANGESILVSGDTAVLNISGGIIKNTVNVKSAKKISLSGKVNIERLALAEDVKLTLGKLKANSSIGVSASGVFTVDNKDTKNYKDYFKPAGKNDKIEFTDSNKKSLTYVSVGGFDNSNLEFTGNKAWCPVCEADVEWTALTAAVTSLEQGKHYYVSADITFPAETTGTFLTVPNNGSVCVHLNGKEVKLGDGMGFLTFAKDTTDWVSGTAIVMGNGTVISNTNSGTLLDMGNGGTAKLYGGTYYNKGTGPVAVMQTSNLYVEEGVVISTPEYPNAIELRHSVDAQLFVNGGTIQAVKLQNNNKITLSGKPVIASLTIPSGKTITLGNLKDGASITINATGAFTKANSKAADYTSYLKPVDSENKKITLKSDNIFYMEDKGNTPPVEVDYTSKLVDTDPATAGMQAYCPVCREVKTWEAYTDSGTTKWPYGQHIYLTGNLTSSNDEGCINTGSAHTASCIHLNGYSIIRETGTAQNALRVDKGTVNIMGTGTVKGNRGGYGATIYVSNGATVNIYSGTYEKGSDLPLIYVAGADSACNIYGGTINGDVSADAEGAISVNGGTVQTVKVGNDKVTLSGKPTIAKLIVSSGKTVTLGDLAAGADITVEATGAFTKANNKAADYTSYLKPADTASKVIKLKDNIFHMEDKTVAPPAETPEELDFTSNLVDTDSSTNGIQAYCPVCKKNVTWKAANVNSKMMTNWDVSDHFYLPSSIEASYGDSLIATNGVGKVCLHLNGNNIINTNNRAIYIDKATDTLNILGTGTVKGSGGYGVTIYNKGTLNLYGGLYTRSATLTNASGDMLLITNPGSYLNIYDDVTFVDPTTKNTIRGEGGGDINIQGADIQGIVSATACQSIKVSGDVVIKRLNMNKDHRLTVGTLVDGASITVNNCVDATKDLTFSNAPASYAPYFKSGNAGEAVVPTKDGKLAYAAAEIVWTDEASKKAICPVCNEEVTWQALNNSSLKSVFLYNNSQTATHFYAEEDLTRNDGDGAIITTTSNGNGDGQSVYCLHLNGKNLTNTSATGRAFYLDAQPGKPSDTLNVMGGGTVTAGGGGQGILYVRNSNNNLNLYGGTYVVTGTQNIIGDFRGPTTIGDGVTFQKKDDATITNVKGTTLTMLGGKVEGVLNILDNKTSTAAATTAGAIVMKGGTIDGTLAIVKQDDENLVGSATITGGVIGKMTMDAKATVTVAGAPVINMLEIPANAKITLGALLRSAKITVKASGVFTNANDNVAAYKDYFVAATGSIQVDGKTLKCS